MPGMARLMMPRMLLPVSFLTMERQRFSRMKAVVFIEDGITASLLLDELITHRVLAIEGIALFFLLQSYPSLYR